ncbi:hypothetical protein Hypma_004610 [Hypsizygus marmoreus]|uniref:Uncharacterized protein n=1 Tax=Hypsizygus marmoreus TaxID=39966 RepID=A0A369K5T7_HYPMA|nr:hypothetical protein Hypma_004610 [Hypsizygus marmoreus]
MQPPLHLCSLPFLSNHPKLQSLSIRPTSFLLLPSTQARHYTTSTNSKSLCPSLTKFLGPISLARRVLTQSLTVRHASLLWLSGDNGCDIIPYLAGCKSLEKLDVVGLEWNHSLVPLNASHLRHLDCLTFCNSSPTVVPKFLTNGFLDTIESSIQALPPSLKTIAIAKIFDGAECTMSALDEEFACPHRWGNLRPSLSCSSLPNTSSLSRLTHPVSTPVLFPSGGTQWARWARYTVWFPGMGGPTFGVRTVKAEWTVLAVLEGKYPEDVLDILVDLNGEKIYPQLVQLHPGLEEIVGKRVKVGRGVDTSEDVVN